MDSDAERETADPNDPIVAYVSPEGNWVCLECAKTWDPARGALTPEYLSENYEAQHNIGGNTCSECGGDAFGS